MAISPFLCKSMIDVNKRSLIAMILKVLIYEELTLVDNFRDCLSGIIMKDKLAARSA